VLREADLFPWEWLGVPLALLSSEQMPDTTARSFFLDRATVVRALLGTPSDVVERASGDEQARVAAIMEHILPVSPRRAGLLNEVAVTSTLERYDLEHIAAPTLAISAADDLYGTFDGGRYTADHIPGARFIGFASGGHLCVGHQQEITSEIAAFLTEAVPHAPAS